MSSSARGSRHERVGAPNQDAALTRTFRGAAGEFTVVAVADGHGGRRYVRSHVGARLAVEAAVDAAASAIAREGWPPADAIETHAQEHIALPLIARWRAACLQHLAASPFRLEERAMTDEPLDGEPLLSYGSTVLVAVLGCTASVLLQLGDGDCLIGDGEGRASSPIPADDNLVAGETASLCLPGAEADVRVAAIDGDAVRLVLLATDGYGVAFADPHWREAVVRDLLATYREHGPAHLKAKLPAWLAESAAVGGDDVTVTTAFRIEAGTG